MKVWSKKYKEKHQCGGKNNTFHSLFLKTTKHKSAVELLHTRETVLEITKWFGEGRASVKWTTQLFRVEELLLLAPPITALPFKNLCRERQRHRWVYRLYCHALPLRWSPSLKTLSLLNRDAKQMWQLGSHSFSSPGLSRHTICRPAATGRINSWVNCASTARDSKPGHQICS